MSIKEPLICSDGFLIKELEASLLDQLTKVYKIDKTINDDLLESLYFVYKNPLLEALNQIDKSDSLQLEYQKKFQDTNIATSPTSSLVSLKQNNIVHYPVTSFEKENDKSSIIYQVKGSLDINYYLFDSLNFCSCSSFKYNVLTKCEYIYCKHIVLIKLAKAMKKINKKVVNDTQFVDLIKQIQ
jgi:predicted nucleic acid-binding Zn finger protein